MAQLCKIFYFEQCLGHKPFTVSIITFLWKYLSFLACCSNSLRSNTINYYFISLTF